MIGRTIHKPSVDAVRDAVEIVRSENLKLEIIGVGGVSNEGDAHDFFDAGAAAVLMGSSPMYMPDIAAELKARHPEW